MGQAFQAMRRSQDCSGGSLLPVKRFVTEKKTPKIGIVAGTDTEPSNSSTNTPSRAPLDEDLRSLHARGVVESATFVREKSLVGNGNADGVPMGAVWKNLRSYPVELYWDDGNRTERGVYIGEIPARGVWHVLVFYTGDGFKVFRKRPRGSRVAAAAGGPSWSVGKYVMEPGKRTYVVHLEDEAKAGEADKNHLQRHRDEEKFNRKYLDREGVPWLGWHPPDSPPSLFMYKPGKALGEVAHTVAARRTTAEAENNSRGGRRWRRRWRLVPRFFSSPGDAGTGWEAEEVQVGPERSSWDLLNLTALGRGFPEGPTAFLVENLLSNEDCEHVKELASARLRTSYVGDSRASDIRTSKLTFLPRTTSKRLEAMHRRFADVLGLKEEDLEGAVEDLQVVRYQEGQEYQPHFDYGRTKRLATLLIYLDPAETGGATSFPLAFSGFGLQVRPRRGSGILFYSQRPDGNLDELSLHGATPVVRGTKWVCNLWVHAHPHAWRKGKGAARGETPIPPEL